MLCAVCLFLCLRDKFNMKSRNENRICIENGAIIKVYEEWQWNHKERPRTKKRTQIHANWIDVLSRKDIVDSNIRITFVGFNEKNTADNELNWWQTNILLIPSNLLDANESIQLSFASIYRIDDIFPSTIHERPRVLKEHSYLRLRKEHKWCMFFASYTQFRIPWTEYHPITADRQK